MYKVLLVDDEIFVRKGLLGLIDWESLGFMVCSEADNGEEALHLIEEHQPDVVITDIRMPVLDGLMLIERVKTRCISPCKFIILSGYSDFSYAQTAIRFGVSDYILKPIEEEDLEAMLVRIARQIEAERRERVMLERQLVQDIIEQSVAGTVTSDTLQLLSQMLKLRPKSEISYGIVEVNRGAESERNELELERLKEQELTLLTDAFLTLTESSRHAVYPLLSGQYGFLIGSDRLGQFGGQFHRFAEALQSLLFRRLRAQVTIYLGRIVPGTSLLAESVQSARTALQYKYVTELKDIILADALGAVHLSYAEPESGLFQKMMEAVEEQDKERIVTSVTRLFDEIRKKPIAKEVIRTSINRQIHKIIGTLQDMSGGDEQLSTLKPMLGWDKYPLSLQDLQALFMKFMLESSSAIDRLRRDQTKGSIHKIKAYIEAHFQENITLKSIAAEFYMNPVYVGQLFKKHYGTYFNEFLLSIRISEARKLLRQTDMRIYEIAERIGFNNADYFVAQFEKLEGMSPSEYRKKLLSHDKEV